MNKKDKRPKEIDSRKLQKKKRKKEKGKGNLFSSKLESTSYSMLGDMMDITREGFQK